MIHTVKGFGIVNRAEIDVFLELSCFFDDPVNIGNLIVDVQPYVNGKFPDVQAGFRKGRGTRDKLPTSAGSSKKQESSRKTSISALLTVWITINCGKF